MYLPANLASNVHLWDLGRKLWPGKRQALVSSVLDPLDCSLYTWDNISFITILCLLPLSFFHLLNNNFIIDWLNMHVFTSYQIYWYPCLANSVFINEFKMLYLTENLFLFYLPEWIIDYDTIYELAYFQFHIQSYKITFHSRYKTEKKDI